MNVNANNGHRPSTDDSPDTTDSPVGELRAGLQSKVGRRAQVLAGLLTTTAAAVAVAAADIANTSISHSSQ